MGFHIKSANSNKCLVHEIESALLPLVKVLLRLEVLHRAPLSFYCYEECP